MSFLDAQDLASLAAGGDFLALLVAAWAAAFVLRRRRR
jgi:hypothetical protein